MQVRVLRWMTLLAAIGILAVPAPGQPLPDDEEFADDIGKLMEFAAKLGKGRLARDLDDLEIRHRTAHYAMAGTVDERPLREYGRCLEYVHTEYARGFAKLLKEKPRRGRRTRTPQPADSESEPGEKEKRDPDADRFRVIIFATQQEFLDFTMKYLLLDMEHAGGCYIPRLKLLIVLDLPNRTDTYQVLFHEAFHQFFHHHLAAPPVWLDEGLATYFEMAQVKGRRVRIEGPHSYYWKIARKLVEKEADIPLQKLISADRATFYNLMPLKVTYRGRELPRRLAYYAQAHTLVDLLQTDPQGLQHLQDYIRELAADTKGRKAARITAKYFDEQACRGLTASWRRHVMRHRQ